MRLLVALIQGRRGLMALAVAVKLRAANSKAIYYAHRPYHKATDHDEDAPALAGGAAPDLPRLATAQDPVRPALLEDQRTHRRLGCSGAAQLQHVQDALVPLRDDCHCDFRGEPLSGFVLPVNFDVNCHVLNILNRREHGLQHQQLLHLSD